MKEKKETVGEWEIRKHMAIEVYPMSLEKQREYMKAGSSR